MVKSVDGAWGNLKVCVWRVRPMHCVRGREGCGGGRLAHGQGGHVIVRCYQTTSGGPGRQLYGAQRVLSAAVGRARGRVAELLDAKVGHRAVIGCVGMSGRGHTRGVGRVWGLPPRGASAMCMKGGRGQHSAPKWHGGANCNALACHHRSRDALGPCRGLIGVR